jgi:hypothetical protein
MPSGRIVPHKEVGFARDSPLEGDRFEPSVPRERDYAFPRPPRSTTPAIPLPRQRPVPFTFQLRAMCGSTEGSPMDMSEVEGRTAPFPSRAVFWVCQGYRMPPNTDRAACCDAPPNAQILQRATSR